MRPRNLIVGCLSGLAIAAGIWVAMNTTAVQTAAIGTATVLPVKAEIPAFELQTHTGEFADETIFAGQWDLVFFGFTHCPDVCPLTLKVLQNAKAELGQRGFDPLPRIVLVSVDPDRDTPERLAAYVSAFGDDNLGLTGSVAELHKLADGIGIFFEKREGEGDQYQVDHSSVVLVIDPRGRFHALFSSPHRIENFVHDLPILLDG